MIIGRNVSVRQMFSASGCKRFAQRTAPDEDKELEQEVDRLSHAVELKETSARAAELLSADERSVIVDLRRSTSRWSQCVRTTESSTRLPTSSVTLATWWLTRSALKTDMPSGLRPTRVALTKCKSDARS